MSRMRHTRAICKCRDPAAFAGRFVGIEVIDRPLPLQPPRQRARIAGKEHLLAGSAKQTGEDPRSFSKRDRPGHMTAGEAHGKYIALVLCGVRDVQNFHRCESMGSRDQSTKHDGLRRERRRDRDVRSRTLILQITDKRLGFRDVHEPIRRQVGTVGR